MERGGRELEEYLVSTVLCDCDHPSILRYAEQLVAGAQAPKEKALRIFYGLRDEIRFGIAYSSTKASQTLKKGYGECLTKTNLQVALLRAVGIPARLRMVRARSEALEHVIWDFIYQRLPPVCSHYWCECYLDGRWISCEAMLDRALYDGLLRLGLLTRDKIPTMSWDGETNLILLQHWITEDRGTTYPSLDLALQDLRRTEEGIPPKFLEWLVAWLVYPYSVRQSDKIRHAAGFSADGQ